jgi:hypothetical protein
MSSRQRSTFDQRETTPIGGFQREHELIGSLGAYLSKAVVWITQAAFQEMYDLYYRFDLMHKEHKSAIKLLHRFKKLHLTSEPIYTSLKNTTDEFAQFRQEYEWLFFNLDTFIKRMNREETKCSQVMSTWSWGKCVIDAFQDFEQKHMKTRNDPCAGKRGKEWVQCLSNEVSKISSHWFTSRREAEFRGLIRRALIVLEEHETMFSAHVQKGMDTNHDHVISKGELMNYIRNNM